MDNERKAVFMSKIKAILSARGGTIDILRNQKMLNLKLIEKSSRSKKDPSPLSSAMCTMGLKYPISVDAKRASEYGVPWTYLCKDKDPEDRHTHGRILCKKEAIDWWVEHSEVPKESLIKVIDILYMPHRKEVENYYKINWGDAKISWGQPIIERKSVRTKEIAMTVPPKLRDSIVREALFPELTLPDRRITPAMREDVRKLIDLGIESRMSLSSQIRVLLNNLDPKIRCLPMLPGSGETVAGFRHAVSHSNYVLTNIKIADPANPKGDLHNQFLLVMKSIVYEAKRHKWDVGTIRKIMDRTTIKNMGMDEITANSKDHISPVVKFAKAIYSMEDTMETNIEGFVTCPVLAQMRSIKGRNKSKFGFTYNGMSEAVNFKYGDIKGNFTHSSRALISVVMNFTTIRDAIATLAEIAVHIKWDFNNTIGKDSQTIRSETRRKVTNRPWEIISASKEDFNSFDWKNKEEDHCGCMLIRESTEYCPTGAVKMVISRNLNLLLEGTQQEIEVSVTKGEVRCYEPEVVCNDSRMLAYFTFTALVKDRFSYMLRIWKDIREKIERGDFKHENWYFEKYLQTKSRAFSKACRRVLNRIIDEGGWDTSYCCFFYMFCYKDPTNVDTELTKITTAQGYTIDLSSETGIFLFDKEKGRYTVLGKAVGYHGRKIDLGSTYNGMLSGYRITSEDQELHPMRSLRRLEEEYMSIRDGERFSIFISGIRYTAIRDSSLSYSTIQTMIRQSRERKRKVEGEESLAEKRQWFVGHRSFDEPEEKKQKLDSDAEYNDLFSTITDDTREEEEEDIICHDLFDDF